MSVAEFLSELRSRDIQVWADGDRLRCNARAGMLTPELRGQLQQRKDDILEFLRSAQALARQERAIVPLQRHGARVSVFAVGGHNGDVFCYRALAQSLGDDQPFFGLQPPGLDGHSEPLTRVEDLAAYFAAQIRTFQTDGPCIIAGFCAGGTVAFELARQLMQGGRTVSFVALFGSPYPTYFRFSVQLAERLAHQAERATKHVRALAPLSWAERRRYLAEKRRQREERLDAERAPAQDPVLALRAKVEQATLAAVRRFTPSYFAGRVCLFLPCREWGGSGVGALRWRSMARRTEEYFGPNGCNADNMLRETYAPAFAELFRRCQEKTEIEVNPGQAGGLLGCFSPNP